MRVVLICDKRFRLNYWTGDLPFPVGRPGLHPGCYFQNCVSVAPSRFDTRTLTNVSPRHNTISTIRYGRQRDTDPSIFPTLRLIRDFPHPTPTRDFPKPGPRGPDHTAKNHNLESKPPHGTTILPQA